MDRAALLESLEEYSFFQTIDLGDGVKTPGRPAGRKEEQVLGLIRRMDLEGKRVVDLGCSSGLYALAAEKQGAREVIAVDHTKQDIEAMERIILPQLNSKVRATHLNMLDFEGKTHGKFDLVIFAGLLHHLRYPFWALRIVRDLLSDGGLLILGAGIIEDFNRNAILYCASPADSPQETRSGNSCAFFQ